MQTNNRSYEDICNDLRKTASPKKMRQLHKELRPYGDGIPFIDRYPYIPTLIAIAALIIACIKQ